MALEEAGSRLKIADFGQENVDCIRPVFKEFAHLCKSIDLFGAEIVAIDGGK